MTTRESDPIESCRGKYLVGKGKVRAAKNNHPLKHAGSRIIIAIIWLLILVNPAGAVNLQGTVIAVQGDAVTVKVESAETLHPAVGDILSILEPTNEEGNALGIPGKWVITEVNGDIVKAEGENLLKGLRPKVNMQAIIHISPGPVKAEEAPKVNSEQPSSSTAKGKVIMTRGNNVTIQLVKGQSAVSKGDAVELSYRVDDMVISVGKWRIQAINENGTVEAEPVEAEAQPTIDMDALVFTSTPEKSERVKSKTEPPKSSNLGTAKDERSKYESKCSKGDADACNTFGNFLRYGIGVTRDYTRAVSFYQQACNGGNSEGCSNLGFMYEYGGGVKLNKRLAADYYKKGCEGGNAMGCSFLGHLYKTGEGVDQDYSRAIEYFKRGCDGGNRQGCGSLGWMYFNGRGTATDQARGQELMKKACKMGHNWSCTKLKKLGS